MSLSLTLSLCVCVSRKKIHLQPHTHTYKRTFYYVVAAGCACVCVFFFFLLSVFAQHILTINHSGLCRVAQRGRVGREVPKISAMSCVRVSVCVGQCDLFYNLSLRASVCVCLGH